MPVTLPGNMKIDDPLGFKFADSNIAQVVSAITNNIVFPLAGIILFIMLVLGGFEMLTSVGNPEGIKKGQGRIVSALIGFVILFVAFWLMQIIQTIFGLTSIFSV